MKKIVFLLLFNLLVSAIYAADGDLDTAFTGSITSFGSEANLYKVRLGANDKIYASGVTAAVGGANYTKSIVRLNADGTRDTSFNPAIDSFGTIYDFAVYPDNKVVVAGAVLSVAKIVRLNPDGSLDSGFTAPTFDTNADSIRSFALQPDGKILVGGYFTNIGGTARASLARLNADGSVDQGFNGNLGGDSLFYVRTIVPQPDIKILIGGTFKTVSGAVHFEIARLNADGSSDTVFNQGVGAQRADSPNSVNGVNDIKLLSNGKVYYIGFALSYNGAAVGEVVRLNADGTRDTGFSLAPNNVGRSGLAIQSDGKILALGNGRNYTSGFPVIRNGITKINTDGSIDTSFSPVGIPNGKTVYSAAIQPDGKIILVGDFGMFNNVQKFSIVRLLNTISAPPVINPALKIADFDGDGRTDASVFRNGTWFINPSTAPSLAPTSAYSVQFGLGSDRLAPADYDGDGKTDIAVWRETEGNFYILNSSNNSVRVENFGLAGDVLTVGDWDGDGKADLSVYREGGAQSYFFYRGSLNNPSGNVTYLPFGVAGDKAVRGDFDGDGKLDAAVFRASNGVWYIRQSSNSQIRYENWGLATDKFVPADYDGDGKTDLAVFRSSGVWYIKQSSNAQILYISWGVNTDSLVPADYNGDGYVDVAVWRSGVYYIRNTANGAASYQYFGNAGDRTAASAFIQ